MSVSNYDRHGVENL
jgi:hypothetical protein